MKRVWLALALIAVVGFFLLQRETPGPGVPSSGTPLSNPGRVGGERAGALAPEAQQPLRNPFRYADEPNPSARPLRPSAAPSSEPAASVKLVGFMRGSQGLEAVLSLGGGDVGLGKAGDVFEGYTILSVDEDEGVRLRGPEGHEITLAPS
jgi:hypothetical protein